MKEMLQMGMMIGLLLPMAIEDLCRKRLSARWILGIGAAGLCRNLSFCGWGTAEVFLSLLTGACLLLLSWKSNGIGSGDGILFLGIGMVCGLAECFLLLGRSLLLCLFAGIFCRVVLKKPKDTRLPFAPFVLTAYLLGVMSDGG